MAWVVAFVLFQGLATASGRFAFLVVGDPQYLADKKDPPERLDPFSEEANTRAIQILNGLPGQPIPEELGGGQVSQEVLGVINTGDLIDSADKNGKVYRAMQKFEWARYQADYGASGKEAQLQYPVYEVHGNHDGPQGDTFIVDGIIRRNEQRPGLVGLSGNGLHYSWDWGPLHCVNLGMFAGMGEKRREGHHYAPRASLEFLEKDLQQHVGKSGRPVILSFHLHPNCPEYDWPEEDLSAFWKMIRPYNVIALFHGHTHGSPPSRMMWDGKSFARDLPGGIDVFNPDDVGAAKRDRKDPCKGVGTSHGFLYVELLDKEGTCEDQLVVWSYVTRDNWGTHGWNKVWTRQVPVP